MSGPPGAQHIDAAAIYDRLLQAALPLPAVDRLCETLARFWCAVRNATACTVRVETPEGTIVRRVDASGSTSADAGSSPAVSFALGERASVTFDAPTAELSAELTARLAEICGQLIGESLRLQDFDARLQREKLAAMAELAAGAGHEINNPVATIVGRTELLLRTEQDPNRRAALTTIGGQAYRIRDMIADLMLFARPPQPEFTALDLNAEVAAVVEAVRRQQTGPEEIRLKLAEQPVSIRADRTQLAVAVSALLRNSLEAAGETAVVEVETAPVSEGGLVSVRDNGPGLSETDARHLFDPFYSGRAAGRGLGFGLAKLWRIVEQHHGRVEVQAPAEGGLAVSVLWPGAAAG